MTPTDHATRRSVLMKLYPKMRHHYGQDIAKEYNRQRAWHRIQKCLALGGLIGIGMLFARALGALALQDGHSLWLILPSVICLLWGTWSIHFLLTRHH